MLRDHTKLIRRAVTSADVLVSALLFVGLLSFSELHRGTGVTRPEEWRLLAAGLVGTLTWTIVADQIGLYDSLRRSSISEIITRLAITAAIATAVLMVVMFVVATPLARRFPFIFGLIQLLSLGVLRFSVIQGLHTLRRSGHNYRDVLIAGTGKRAAAIERTIAHHPEWGLRITGFTDDAGAPLDPSLDGYDLYKMADVPNLLRDSVIDEVILACPLSVLPSMRPLVAVCAEAGVPVMLLSDLFGDDLPPPQLSQLGSLSALSFASVHHSELEISIKRCIDVVGGAVLLVATAPIVAIAALLIRLDSPGPVFFRQKRCGLHGRGFELLKLRTMSADAEERRRELLHLNEMDGSVFKIRDDPRITRVGRILRRTSIDEIPQFWNVLIGNMSLVGPRPPLPAEVSEYSTFERRRISVRPELPACGRLVDEMKSRLTTA